MHVIIIILQWIWEQGWKKDVHVEVKKNIKLMQLKMSILSH